MNFRKGNYWGVKVSALSLFLVALATLAFSRNSAWFMLTNFSHRVRAGTLSGEYDESANWGNFYGKTYAVPHQIEDDPLALETGQVLGGEKRIEVDLTNQRLYAFEGDHKVYDFVISTGKPWWPTPTGEFRFWIRLRYTRMRGGSSALGTYYDLPNVPFTMYFEGSGIPGWKGYGIHGTYWHNNFGHPMSHGCVNLKIPDAEKLFYWSSSSQEDGLGTRIIIYGSTPSG